MTPPAKIPDSDIGISAGIAQALWLPQRSVKAADMTWAEVRATAARLLPGARYRRHLLWRYSLLWTKR
jgi:hypothetical protein